MWIENGNIQVLISQLRALCVLCTIVHTGTIIEHYLLRGRSIFLKTFMSSNCRGSSSVQPMLFSCIVTVVVGGRRCCAPPALRRDSKPALLKRHLSSTTISIDKCSTILNKNTFFKLSYSWFSDSKFLIGLNFGVKNFSPIRRHLVKRDSWFKSKYVNKTRLLKDL